MENFRNGSLKLPKHVLNQISKLVLNEPIIKEDGFAWRESKELLFEQMPSIDDINQQNLGDCYLLAVLQSILLSPFGSNFINQMMLDLGNTVVVRLFIPSYPEALKVLIVVNKSVLFKRNRESHSSFKSPLWVRILEKALVSLAYGKNYLDISSGRSNLMMDLIAGFSSESICYRFSSKNDVELQNYKTEIQQYIDVDEYLKYCWNIFYSQCITTIPNDYKGDFTEGVFITFRRWCLKNNLKGNINIHAGNLIKMSQKNTQLHIKLYDFIRQCIDDDKLMCVSSKNFEDKRLLGIAGGHAYCVHGYADKTKGKVRDMTALSIRPDYRDNRKYIMLANPWGSDGMRSTISSTGIEKLPLYKKIHNTAQGRSFPLDIKDFLERFGCLYVSESSFVERYNSLQNSSYSAEAPHNWCCINLINSPKQLLKMTDYYQQNSFIDSSQIALICGFLTEISRKGKKIISSYSSKELFPSVALYNQQDDS